MCKAMANLLELNGNSRDSWATAVLLDTPKFKTYRITAADGITLAIYGLTQVGQSWGNDDITGRISRNVDAQYPEDSDK
jgi:hypothetical protein